MDMIAQRTCNLLECPQTNQATFNLKFSSSRIRNKELSQDRYKSRLQLKAHKYEGFLRKNKGETGIKMG